MQARNPEWKTLYPKARYRIFFLDDLPFWVRKVRDTLAGAGYTVFTATSREEALGILNDTHVHLGIFDVNLAHGDETLEDSEPLNQDGLDLAAEVKFPPVRLIFSIHKNIDWIRKSFYDAHVADYVIKEDDKVTGLLQKIESTIAGHLHLNYDLQIHWENSSLQELVSLLSPQLELEAQFERMMELNDLLRMQFYKEGNQFFEQISLELLPVDKARQVWLKVQAYTSNGDNRQFLLLCGEQGSMGENPHKLEGRMLRTIGAEACMQTVHYRLELFEVIDGSLRELDTLARHWQNGDRDLVGDALEEICQGRYQRSRQSKTLHEGSLAQLALGMNEPVNEAMIEPLYQIALRISHEWRQHIPDSSFTISEDRLHYALNSMQEYPNPILHLDSLSRLLVKRKMGKVQGDLRLETIIARDSDGELLWMPDEAYHASLLRDYVTLERSLHLLEISRIELEAYETLAQVLNDYENEEAAEVLNPEIQGAARLIQQIRRFAIKELGCTLDDYLQDLYMDLMDYLGTYPPLAYVGYATVMQYSHCLLFAGQLCRDLLATSVETGQPLMQEGIRLDEEHRKLRVWTQSVRLTEKQFAIFRYLFERVGETCSYAEIIQFGLQEKLLPDIEDEKPHIHTAMCRLRKRISPLGFAIESSRTGYSLKKP